MTGLVLWYNQGARIGMVWCEDQGPLAFLGPDVTLPPGIESLSCGDQITFTIDVRDDVRYVRDVFAVASGGAHQDPCEIIAGYHDTREVTRHLSIVA